MRDGPHKDADPDKRSPGTGRRSSPGAGRPSGFVERATARGRSGHGSESIRPHLRDQLRLKELLGTPFTPPEPDDKPDEGA